VRLEFVTHKFVAHPSEMLSKLMIPTSAELKQAAKEEGELIKQSS